MKSSLSRPDHASGARRSHTGSSTYRARRQRGVTRLPPRARQCYAHVYLDNLIVYRGQNGEPLFDTNSLRPDGIEAIEYYTNNAEMPARYLSTGSDCGVLVVWTRRTY